MRWMNAALLTLLVSTTLGGCGDDETGEAAVTGGAPCGPATCAADQYCCFAECGLCAPQGVACPQTGCD